MTDDEMLAGLAAAARREDRELTQLEAEPLDDAAIERAASQMQQALPEPGTVAPPRTSRRRVAWAAIAAVGAAAAIVTSMARGPSGPPDLPAYEVSLLAGGAQTERGLTTDTPSAIPARPGGRLDLVARPATRVQGPVETETFLIHDGRTSPWEAAVEIAPDGSARLRGSLDEHMDLSSGSWTLAVVIARAGSLPRDPSAGGDGAGHAWQVARVRLVPPSSP